MYMYYYLEKMIKNEIIDVSGLEKPEKEIPSILNSFLITIHFTVGLDFGFSKFSKKNVKFLTNCYCRLLSIFLITAIIMQIVYKIRRAQVAASSWLIYSLIQYSMHVIFLSFSKYNLRNLIVDVNSVKKTICNNKNNPKRFVSTLVIAFCIMYTIKTSLCYLFCASETDNICDTIYIPGQLYCALVMGMDVITLAQILIYYYIYTTVKDLVVSLVDKDIKWVRKQFTALADICDKITPTYGRLVSTHFVVHVVSIPKPFKFCILLMNSLYMSILRVI